MTFIRCILIAVAFLLSYKTLAYSPKEGNVTATFGPFIYATDFRGGGNGAVSPTRGTFAIVANGDVSDKGALEMAFIHMRKSFLREESPRFIAEELELVHITMGYRRWFSPTLSGSLTFFSSYAMSEARTIYSDFAPGQEIDTSARDITDYGFDFALQQELWTKDLWALVAEARYSLPVTNKKDERADLYGFMLGFRYFIQEKQVVNGDKK